MLAITTANFKTEVEDSGYVLIDFWAEWCTPCKMFSPTFEKVSLDPQFKDIKFAKLNTDEEPTIASSFGVMSIPTTVLLKNGKVVAATSGAMNEVQLKDFIKNNLK